MAKYQSRCHNQVLCIKPARNSIVDGIVVPVPGEHIRFENSEYETDDKKKIDFIERHRLFGTAIVRVDEPKKAQVPPVPPA
ncbi:hypothetical protein J19TS2_30940 [Cohnella xylanilytica]|uniref:hypothetical protein n=1 Tax=Cohnella xylanilytica TaxID=557555 RepID=UPI001AFE3094|nr:hypothetical protein [Cohnella xylanilytica]GIO13539.1 hypothetical protein J19TS2_30940 [Cohnella xylanilytica]